MFVDPGDPGGVPATGAIARTAVNVRTGATSRLAALAHAVILAGIVAVAAPLVGRIPLAALAGVLLATAIRMVETDAVRAMFAPVTVPPVKEIVATLGWRTIASPASAPRP